MCEVCNNRFSNCPACSDNEPDNMEAPIWKQSVATASELAEIQSLYQWDYTEATNLILRFEAKLKEMNPETYTWAITGLFNGLMPEILTENLPLKRIKKVLLNQIYETLNKPTK